MHKRFFNRRSPIAVLLRVDRDAAAQQPVVLQWQTANLTESAVRAGVEATIAEFEAANPGHQGRAGARRAQGPLDEVRRRVAGEEGAVHRRRSTSRPRRTTATSCRSTSTSTPSPPTSAGRGATTCSRRVEVEGPALRPADLGRHVRGDLQPRPRRSRRGSIPSKPPKTLDEYVAWGEEAHRQRPVGHRGARRQDRHHDTRAADVDLVERRRGVQRRHDRGDLRQESEEPRGDQVLPRASPARTASPRPRRRRPTTSSRPTSSRRARSRRCATPTGRSRRSTATTRR